jgi:negative regulator of flagellin synthesis FlgM
MVDPIGPKGSTPTDRIVAAVSVAPAVGKVVAVATEPQPQETQATTAGQLASDFSAKPPVDLDRVSRIKKAIADGNFPFLPATIADQMLALKLNWVPNDAA